MEEHIMFRDIYASPPERRRKPLGPVFMAFAAISATSALMAGILPATDVAFIRQSVANAATHPGGSVHIHEA
jgi:hypothetical protein